MGKDLRKVAEANNAKSPDIHSVTLTASDYSQVIYTAGVYEEVLRKELPPCFVSGWWQTCKLPVELYFLFDNERQKKRFLTRVYKEIGLSRDEHRS